MSCSPGYPPGSGLNNGLQARHRTMSRRMLLCLLLCVSLAAAAGGDNQPLEHVVIVWLKEPGDRDAQQRIIAASQVLTSIPGVVALRTGTAVASDRPVVDSSFDVALVISFTDRAALDSYLTHPLHVQLVESTLKPLVERILVYDFSNR